MQNRPGSPTDQRFPVRYSEGSQGLSTSQL
jgi:hypothetical protein